MDFQENDVLKTIFGLNSTLTVLWSTTPTTLDSWGRKKLHQTNVKHQKQEINPFVLFFVLSGYPNGAGALDNWQGSFLSERLLAAEFPFICTGVFTNAAREPHLKLAASHVLSCRSTEPPGVVASDRRFCCYFSWTRNDLVPISVSVVTEEKYYGWILRFDWGKSEFSTCQMAAQQVSVHVFIPFTGLWFVRANWQGGFRLRLSRSLQNQWDGGGRQDGNFLCIALNTV